MTMAHGTRFAYLLAVFVTYLHGTHSIPDQSGGSPIWTKQEDDRNQRPLFGIPDLVGVGLHGIRNVFSDWGQAGIKDTDSNMENYIPNNDQGLLKLIQEIIKEFDPIPNPKCVRKIMQEIVEKYGQSSDLFDNWSSSIGGDWADIPKRYYDCVEKERGDGSNNDGGNGSDDHDDGSKHRGGSSDNNDDGTKHRGGSSDNNGGISGHAGGSDNNVLGNGIGDAGGSHNNDDGTKHRGGSSDNNGHGSGHASGSHNNGGGSGHAGGSDNKDKAGDRNEKGEGSSDSGKSKDDFVLPGFEPVPGNLDLNIIKFIIALSKFLGIDLSAYSTTVKNELDVICSGERDSNSCKIYAFNIPQVYARILLAIIRDYISDGGDCSKLSFPLHSQITKSG